MNFGKTILSLIGIASIYVFMAIQFDIAAQSSSPAATRAYCDNNRNIAAQQAAQSVAAQLPSMVSGQVSQEVERIAASIVPIPVPVTNTVYVDTVISSQMIYQTTNVLVYSEVTYSTNNYYSFTTNYVTYITTNTTLNITSNIVDNITISNTVTELNVLDILIETNTYFQVGADDKLRLFINGIKVWEEK